MARDDDRSGDQDALAEFEKIFGKSSRPQAPTTRVSAPAPRPQAPSRQPPAAPPAPPVPGVPRELLVAAEAERDRLAAALQAALSERDQAIDQLGRLAGRVAELEDKLARALAERRSEPAAAPPAPPEATDDPGAIAAALRRFNNACLLTGTRYLAIVGGSPSYHEQLRDGVDKRIDLRLVAGDVSRPPRFPERTRVVIWGATELDHSVSSAYPGAWSIPYRGITRFLDELSRRIDGS